MQNRLFKLLLIFLFSLTATLGHATAGGKQAQAEVAILATLAKGLVGEGVGVVAIKGTQLSIQSAKVVVQKTRQTVKFSTDDLGRINKVEGKLNLDIKDRNSHQQNSQLITSMLNGPSGKTRLLSGNLNEGEWRKLEKEWMSALKEGKSVKVSVEPVYSGNSTRPESFKINYFIDDRLTQKVFQNTAPKGGTITQTTTGRTITQVTKGEGQKLGDLSIAKGQRGAVGVAKGVAPSEINFSQRTVSGNIEQYVRDMKAGNWDWNRSGPIRIMRQDGKWVSYDNRRLMAAQQAGLKDIPYEVVDPKAIMPGSKKTWEQAFRKRFNDQRNVDAGGAVPSGGLSTQPSIAQ